MEQHGYCTAVSCCTKASSKRSIVTKIEALIEPTQDRQFHFHASIGFFKTLLREALYIRTIPNWDPCSPISVLDNIFGLQMF